MAAPDSGYQPPPPQYSQAAYPPPQTYPPQQEPKQPPPQATTVVVTQPVVTTQPLVFRDRPVLIVDSNGQQVQTVLEYRTGTLTWLICCLICWITGCWCLALVPFCIDATKDVYHISPTDGKVVGVYNRL